MYYPASETIAAKHSDLHAAVEGLDFMLAHHYQGFVRVDRAADQLQISPRQAEYLLREYEAIGIAHRDTLPYCRDCDDIVEEGNECDRCEQTIPPSAKKTSRMFMWQNVEVVAL